MAAPTQRATGAGDATNRLFENINLPNPDDFGVGQSDTDRHDDRLSTFWSEMNFGAKFTEFQQRVGLCCPLFAPILKRMKLQKSSLDDVSFIENFFDDHLTDCWKLCSLKEKCARFSETNLTLHGEIEHKTREHARIVTDLTVRIRNYESERFSMAKYRSLPQMDDDVVAKGEDVCCVICKTYRPQKDVILSCGHQGIMCKKCIYRLFSSPPSDLRCPLCRTDLLCALKIRVSTVFTKKKDNATQTGSGEVIVEKKDKSTQIGRGEIIIA